VKILVVGDSYMPVDLFQRVFAPLLLDGEVSYLQVDSRQTFVPSTPSERTIREYEGSPVEIREAVAGHEVLVVHGAPVTDSVLDGSERLALVCCARGGPVNIDVSAATRRGIPVVTTPGKNADAVADLTLAFITMLARGVPRGQAFLQQGGRVASTFEGARFLGHNLANLVLGLIGYGHVGRAVAVRASALGMRVLAYDPYVGATEVRSAGAEPCSFPELLERSDVVSLHARATPSNVNLFKADTFARMRRGALFVNTARETLVDESALSASLLRGHLGGAALDVISQGASPNPLLALNNVIVTPHIGGATYESLINGAEMVAAEIARFAGGRPLLNVADRTASVAKAFRP
jgi:D-3-phosphoglycerate dehydrogenase